jgi:RNA-binding protein
MVNAEGITGPQNGAYIVAVVHGLDRAVHVAKPLVKSLFQLISSDVSHGRRVTGNDMDLTGKQRRHLRGLAHHLDPVVTVGKEGVTNSVVGKLNDELELRELLKVKVTQNAPESVKETAVALAAASKSAVAQTIGRTVVLYRRRKEKPEIRLPKAG